ncbi:MAG: hypothetical protein HC817_13870 [Saprospiraceae bacterium]|nr:hypothetical protein [Saprospiraceae bacterium]
MNKTKLLATVFWSFLFLNINAKPLPFPIFKLNGLLKLDSSFMNTQKVEKEEGVFSNEVIIQIVPCIVCQENHDRSVLKTAFDSADSQLTIFCKKKPCRTVVFSAALFL